MLNLPSSASSAAVEVGEVNSLPVNYGMSFSLRAPMDSVGAWRAEASLGTIKLRFETALMRAAGYNLGGMLTTCICLSLSSFCCDRLDLTLF